MFIQKLSHKNQTSIFLLTYKNKSLLFFCNSFFIFRMTFSTLYSYSERNIFDIKTLFFALRFIIINFVLVFIFLFLTLEEIEWTLFSSKQEINDSTIRTLRNRAMNSAEDHHIQLRNFSDFYSLSEFRDLVFHVQEHRFNLPQIKNCLAELDLKFCGFEQPPFIEQFKRMYSDDGSLLDLNKWHAFEEDNPHAFSGMYQFWCQKK